jgi:hypothetical protein
LQSNFKGVINKNDKKYEGKKPVSAKICTKILWAGVDQ